MIGSPSPIPMIIVLLVIVLLFGKLKNIGKDLSTAIKEFRNVFSDKPENKDGGSSSAS